MTPPFIRFATLADIPAIRKIYAPYVAETTVSFEAEPPGEAEMARRIEERKDRYPFLVGEQDGVIAGYACAGPMGSRTGWDWAVESSIYIAREYKAAGIGRALYGALFALLEWQGYCEVYAIIAVPNPESEGFHTRMGFRREGLLNRAGRKFGRVIGVAYYAKTLHADEGDPPLPKSLSLLPANAAPCLLNGHLKP